MRLVRSFAVFSLVLSAAACSVEGDDEVSVAPTTELDPQGSAHLKGGKRAEPSFVDHGLSLSSSAAVSGLGNGDVVVRLTAVGQPSATCTNPAGATQPAGQNPVEVELTGVQAIPASAIKNGSLSFTVSTGAPASDVAGAPGCPNPQWSETITDVSFSSATITVEQGGAAVIGLSCSITPSSANGAVPAAAVVCTKI